MRDILIESALLEMAKQVGDLYHFTNNNSAEKILDDDHIKSSHGHISTTRNYNLPLDPGQQNGDLKYSNGYNTRLTLDGNKISENHKIHPLLGVTANVSDPTNHSYNSHRVSRHEHENEENVKSDHLPIAKILKHVHVVPDSIDAESHYHNTLKPKLDEMGIPSSVSKKFHRTHINEDSTDYRKHKINEHYVIEVCIIRNE